MSTDGSGVEHDPTHTPAGGPAIDPAELPVAGEPGQGHAPEARRGIMRRTYDWVLMLSRRPTAEWALGILSFAESMIFPIPPDVMLVPMCVARPARALRFAAICSVMSVLGGMAGYAIGAFVWQTVGPWFFDVVPGFTPEKFAKVGEIYQEWGFWFVFGAGFTPFPYKIITISAGVFGLAFGPFVIASFVGRSARFFLVAACLWKWGDAAQDFIERYFNLLAMAFVLLLLGGFLLVTQL